MQKRIRNQVLAAAVSVGITLAGLSNSALASATWSGGTVATTAAWSTTTNWASATDTAGYPNGTDSIATFNGNFTGNIAMTGDTTLGGITFTDTASSNNGLYLGSGTLTFDTSSGTPTINYLNGTTGTGNGILWIGNSSTFTILGTKGLTIDAGNAGQSVRFGASSNINWSNTTSAFSGKLTLAQGSFQPQVANALPQAAGTSVVLGTGTYGASLNLYRNSRNQSIVGLDGTANSSVANGSVTANIGTLTLGTNSVATDSFDFQGQIGTNATNSEVAIVKNGAGTQMLSGNNLYVGNTTINAGTLKLGNANALGLSGSTATDITTASGSATATVASATGLAVGQSVTGTGIAANTVIANISGTTVTLSANATANGTVTGTFTNGGTYVQGGTLDLNGQTIAESVTFQNSAGTLRNSSASPAVLTADVSLTTDLTVDATGDITATRLIGLNAPRAVTKKGTGTLTLAGISTYTGNTTISAGTLDLASTGGLKFVIGANGVNNKVTGAGTAILEGTFTFDLTNASQNIGDSWTIVDATTTSFASTFAVAAFTNGGSGLWSESIDSTKAYQFSTDTGILSVVSVPEPAMLGLAAVASMGLLVRRQRKA